MNRVQLATIIDWANKVETRKRLQKVVFLLKAINCPLDIDYTLHHYGPYSYELAKLTDEMVDADLLSETISPNAVGKSYSYCLRPRARQQLNTLKSQENFSQYVPFADFESKAKAILCEESLSKLEYAATIAFFRLQGKRWEDAVKAAAEFKNLDVEGPEILEAKEYCQSLLRGG